MSLPQPPGYRPPTTQEIMTQNANMYYPRRPQTWVPPSVMVSSFAAGYAIPWELGPDPKTAFMRFVLPLIVSAGLCCTASFFSFEANKNWRIWSWAAFGFQTVTFFSMWLFPVFRVPRLVLIFLFASCIILCVSSAIGAERLTKAHKRG